MRGFLVSGSPSWRPGGSPDLPVNPSPDWLALLERLWRQPELFSRNKNFEMYQGPVGQRALRGYRLLRSLRRDLRSCSRVVVQKSGRGSQVRIELDAIHGRRTVTLGQRMFDLLVADPEVGERLRAAPAIDAGDGGGDGSS